MEIYNNKERSRNCPLLSVTKTQMIKVDARSWGKTRRWILAIHINVFGFHPTINGEQPDYLSTTPICHIPTLLQNFVNHFLKNEVKYS